MGMVKFDIRDDQITEYFATARERYYILRRRRAGHAGPWTDDRVFRDWRFCNVFREDDRVTEWIRTNVRDRICGRQVIWSMVACRLINRIDNLERLQKEGVLTAEQWHPDQARRILKGVRPVVGPAYVVKTPDGLDKLEGVLSMVSSVAVQAADIAFKIIPGQTTLKEVWEKLSMFPCFGAFMAYEVVTDLRHTAHLNRAPDIMTWSSPGPGACNGASWLAFQEFGKVSYGSFAHRNGAIDVMRRIIVLSNHNDLWPDDWPRWEMRDAEHWLCEYAKYAKVAHLGMRMKRRYR